MGTSKVMEVLYVSSRLEYPMCTSIQFSYVSSHGSTLWVLSLKDSMCTLSQWKYPMLTSIEVLYVYSHYVFSMGTFLHFHRNPPCWKCGETSNWLSDIFSKSHTPFSLRKRTTGFPMCPSIEVLYGYFLTEVLYGYFFTEVLYGYSMHFYFPFKLI